GAPAPLTAVSAAVRTSESHVFLTSLTLSGPGALGAKPAQQLLGKGVFDVHRGLAYERVDLPGPLDRNNRPPRDYLVFSSTRILLSPAAQSALPPGKKVIAVTLPRGKAADAIAVPFV